MKDNIALSWENITLYAPPKVSGGSIFSRKKTSGSSKVKLLNNVSGLAVSGSLTAIMGPSGAGKTTLLTTISQRTTGDFSGSLLLNGHQIDKNLMSRISGFVPQNDMAFEGLTVREHLEFMARLKMDKRTSYQSRRCIVATLVQDLGLAKCYNTQLSRLSGGEKKRVSLAVQMLTDPPFLFCDEPTTGLDSFSAGTVIAVLRSFTQRGKAVLCTIHQPASGIFELFDRVILMVPGGRVAYQGPVDDSIQHFKNQTNNSGALGFASFITPITIAAITSTAYGFCVSAMFESLATASLLSVPLDFVSYVFSGIFIHLGHAQEKHLKYNTAAEDLRASFTPLLPKTIIETFLFSSVVFWIAGLNSGALGFASFITPITIAAITSTAYGFCVSAMFESLATASLLSVPLDFVSYVFSGIFIHLGSLPTYTFWLKYISRFYYATEAISILQWSQVEHIDCPANFNSTCITTGLGVLHKYGYHKDSLGFDFLGLIIMYFTLHYAGYMFLKKRSRNRAVY
ncbi:protein brown [Diaphorina citri]|uniref:Protein brown n=1 Tax=Diaphorina citri TaxID=121845 RepID=A0A3Q0IZ92_DIACI|nr:protein brown [Diaphorina citri]